MTHSKPTGKPLTTQVREALDAVAEPARARAMQAYMKSAMPYFGISTVPRRAALKSVFAGIDWPDSAAWQADVLALWRGATHREERYAAIELAAVKSGRRFQRIDALPMYEEMIVTGAWWDYVDSIASHRVGPIVASHPREMKPLMRQWSRCDDLWKRRTSILCQLSSKKATDLTLLYDCIEPSLGEKEFFLRKAIGWALRQYAWSDAEEIIRYVKEKGDRLSPLSKKEALKNIAAS